MAELYDNSVIVMHKATEPTDILWKNMKGDRGLHIFRRAIIGILLLVIIFFVSSPAVVLMHIKVYDSNDYLGFRWTENLPYGGFLHQYTGPFLVVCINLIIC